MSAEHRHAGQSAVSAWVSRFAPLVPPGEVLDLACGGGRHARLFAARGYAVLAVDRDAAALMQLAAHGDAGLTTLQSDLEASPVPDAAGAVAATVWPFAAHRFAAIVVTNYLYRPLLPLIVASLAPGGLLIYETFARGNEHFGKPSNPDFLLMSGELLAVAVAGGMTVVAFEQGVVALPAPAAVQRICAMRSGDDIAMLQLPG